MAIATQRAKERENRTPDVEVMHKTVKRKSCNVQGSDIRGSGPDIRDLMSRTLRENALQEPDVWTTGRMSGGQMSGATGRMFGLQIRG